MIDIVWNWLRDPGFTIVAIILLGWLARHFGGLLIERTVRRLIHRTHINALSDEDIRKRQDTLIGLFTVIWKALIVIIVTLLLFGELFPRVDLTPIFASAGIIGIALGFGAQSIIKDFFSGVFIIMENQYRVGDVIDIEGAGGTVERLTIRSTVLRDADGNVHFIPNGNITQVTNKTMGFSGINFAITVVPSTNVDRISALIDEVGLQMAEDDEWKAKILEAPHFLSIGAFTDVALEVKITGKTQASAQWSVTGELRERLLKAFAKHKIELAHNPVGYSKR